MTPEQLAAFLAEQRAINDARTPGEWIRTDWNDGSKGFRTVSGPTFMWIEESGTVSDANMPFITAASAHYGQLLDTIEQLQSRVIALEEERYPMIFAKGIKPGLDINNPWKIE